MIKLKKILEEKVDIDDISWNHQKLLKVGSDYIHKTRDGRLWYEIEDDIKKSKDRDLIRYFKKYDEARLKLQHAGAMLTRAFNMKKGRQVIKLKDLLKEELTDADIKKGPQYGEPFFASVGVGNAAGVDSWGKKKKIKVTSKMKKQMIKTLQDAMKSKYKNSEEVDVLKRNGERLSNVLSWVKRL